METSENDESLTFDQFVEGFIAELVSRGVVTINPNSSSTTRALERVCSSLKRAIAAAPDTEVQRQLRSVFNQLRPGSLRTFDHFLASLRSKQLGFLVHPNPRYRELTFRISPTYAQFLLDGLPRKTREVLDDAAQSFLTTSASV